MARKLVPDVLWEEIQPLLPAEPPKPKGGRPRVSDRACLTGIIFVLRTGSPWNQIPAELGCGHGATCWRRFKFWSEEDIWNKVWEKFLAYLRFTEEIDLSRAVVDSSSVRAVFGGRIPDPTPRTEPNPAVSAM